MKKCFLVCLLISICSVTFFAQPKVTKEEYFIYAIVLKQIYADKWKDSKLSFVIINNTYMSESADLGEAKRFEGLIRSFKQRNQVSAILNHSFPTKYQYKITTMDEVNGLLKLGAQEFEEAQKKRIAPLVGGGESWNKFSEKFTDSQGYLQLSRVGFSKNKEFAFVYVKNIGPSHFNSMNYILRKIKGQWKLHIRYGSGGIS